jgi:hypothetical protein
MSEHELRSDEELTELYHSRRRAQEAGNWREAERYGDLIREERRRRQEAANE